MKKRIFCVPQSLSKIGVVVFLKHFPNREISEKNKRVKIWENILENILKLKGILCASNLVQN